ncbi:MAG: hypothetical protein HFG34_01115 [Eubacterium sp.]|nr:hypothetical protein [Eubacterium sp.]
MRKIFSCFLVLVVTMMSFGMQGKCVEAAITYERTYCAGWTFNISINQSSPYGRTISSSNSNVATASITGTQQFNDPVLNVTWYYAVVSITSKSPGTAILSISQSSQKILVNVTEHTWDEGVVTIEPTCSQDGIKTYTCSLCDKIKKEIIATTVDHVWETEYSEDEEANCTESGNKSIHCQVCGEQKEDSSIIIPAKGHNLMKIDAEEETCLEAGNKCYWYCDVCHKYFKDERAIEETTLADVTLPAKGHNLVKTDAEEETCLEAGNKCYWYCDACDKYFNDEKATEETTLADVTLSAKGHNLVKTDAKAETCLEAGNKCYWYCDACHKYFNDERATEETTLADVTLPAKGHNLVKTDAKAETCLEAGNKCYWYCDACDKYFNDEKAAEETTLAETALLTKGTHTWDKGEVVVAATTSSTGIKTYKCISCGKTKTENIPKVLENISSKKLSRTQIISEKVRNKTVKIKWKKVKNAKGYQIRYSKKPTMKGAKKLISKTTSIKLKKLKSNKKYYFQVRAYNINTDGSKRYAKWSKKNKIKMK